MGEVQVRPGQGAKSGTLQRLGVGELSTVVGGHRFEQVAEPEAADLPLHRIKFRAHDSAVLSGIFLVISTRALRSVRVSRHAGEHPLPL